MILRRKRITGLTAHKPISSSTEQAVKELLKLSKSSSVKDIPDTTLSCLSSKDGAYAVREISLLFSEIKKPFCFCCSAAPKQLQLWDVMPPSIVPTVTSDR